MKRLNWKGIVMAVHLEKDDCLAHRTYLEFSWRADN